MNKTEMLARTIIDKKQQLGLSQKKQHGNRQITIS